MAAHINQDEEFWTVYVTAPSQKGVEWDEWPGNLETLIAFYTREEYRWRYLKHNTLTHEVFFNAI